VHRLDHQGGRAAAAVADRRHPDAALLDPQHVEQRDQDAGAARSDGVAQRDRAAVGIDPASAPEGKDSTHTTQNARYSVAGLSASYATELMA
jgi:hypothetical protein